MTSTTTHTPAPLAGEDGLAATPGQPGIDPRAPRFGAGITAALLLVTVGLGLISAAGHATIAARAAEPAFILLSTIAVLFAWGAFAGPGRHPYGVVFKRLVRPRLAAPGHLENPKPPAFAQGVGLAVSLAGVILQLAGVPYGLVAAATAAFVAAFLNAVFDYCLGCQIYLLLLRAGALGRSPAPIG